MSYYRLANYKLNLVLIAPLSLLLIYMLMGIIEDWGTLSKIEKLSSAIIFSALSFIFLLKEVFSIFYKVGFNENEKVILEFKPFQKLRSLHIDEITAIQPKAGNVPLNAGNSVIVAAESYIMRKGYEIQNRKYKDFIAKRVDPRFYEKLRSIRPELFSIISRKDL